jgi:hypothetical protein
MTFTLIFQTKLHKSTTEMIRDYFFFWLQTLLLHGIQVRIELFNQVLSI